MGGFVVHDAKEYLGTLTFEQEENSMRWIATSNLDINSLRGEAIATAIARNRGAALSFHKLEDEVFLHCITTPNINNLTVFADSIYFPWA
jgi:hypothetical protein